ncbi:MAG: hypothetical protein KDD42_09860, partial [Bdellovibrionales bacterium]|nr:hypothetical protein [Bdellovibrionales bacterium]
GALVNIKSPGGAILGQGLVSYSSKDIDRIKGVRSTEISAILGGGVYEEVIHRDNLVMRERYDKA